jgi:hypothetical protein
VLEVLWLPIRKYAIISTPSWNKKLINKHLFVPFIVANNVAYFANNNPNQLHTKVKTKKQLHIKTPSHFLLSSIWMWFFVKILIHHMIMVIALKKPTHDILIIKLFTWLTNTFYSYGITMFSRYYKFPKKQKSFQYIIFHF